MLSLLQFTHRQESHLKPFQHVVNVHSLLLQRTLVSLQQRHQCIGVDITRLICFEIGVAEGGDRVGEGSRVHLAKGLIHALPLSLLIRVERVRSDKRGVQIGWGEHYASSRTDTRTPASLISPAQLVNVDRV